MKTSWEEEFDKTFNADDSEYLDGYSKENVKDFIRAVVKEEKTEMVKQIKTVIYDVENALRPEYAVGILKDFLADLERDSKE